MKSKKANASLDALDVKSKMIVLRGQPVLLDRDVAALYGVETKHINQAVRNNPGKFPAGYKFQLDAEEFANWRSKILTTNLTGEERSGIAKGVRYVPTAFTERGLYMLATILKSPCAVSATLAIVETYAQVRSMVRDMERSPDSEGRQPGTGCAALKGWTPAGDPDWRQSLHRGDQDDNRAESCRLEDHPRGDTDQEVPVNRYNLLSPPHSQL